MNQITNFPNTNITNHSLNYALIFAGGVGRRMNTNGKPKQFLELNGKPILIYTLELFDNHPEIDGIVVVCIKEWIDYLKKMIRKFEINKVIDIVPGGENGQGSIFNGLEKLHDKCDQNSIVLVHDGVRPLIIEKTISDNIKCTRENGNCITCVPATETFIVKQDDLSLNIPDRSKSLLARAPQSFILKDLWAAHQNALADNKTDFIDSCSLMTYYGHSMNTIIGPMENIKITTPTDYFIFRAMVEVHENQQIFGF